MAVTGLWDLPIHLHRKSGLHIVFSVLIATPYALLTSVLKPVIGLIDVVKELIDGIIEYFTPKEFERITTTMRPARLMINSKVLPYDFD